LFNARAFIDASSEAGSGGKNGLMRRNCWWIERQKNVDIVCERCPAGRWVSVSEQPEPGAVQQTETNATCTCAFIETWFINKSIIAN